MASTRERQCGVSDERGGIEVAMISRDVEISIAGGVAETKDANYCDRFFFLFFFFSFFLFFFFF